MNIAYVRPFLLAATVALYFAATAVAAEPEVDQPLPPTEAARTMIVPDGFQVTLFAGEPDVRQPIGFCIDDRGRLWIAEAYNYPHHGTRPGDRIVILEDTDHDGRFDRRKVFYDKLNYVTGIEVGFGGAWVMSPPNFYFIPDRNGDDVPDDEPQVLLDGFGNHANAHNLANGFAWGPDGWLYGTHGRTNWSRLGKPGTPDNQRVTFDGGVYRYHPVRHVWEPYADGTTNPWGIDWNDHGEGFVCNCVNPHLFHVIQGAHYEPWRNRESSRYAYQRIDTIADHLHFVGLNNVRDGLGSPEEDEAGGGHAHCGTMIYLGDNWPERYRNQVFMNNIHGKRINNDLLRRSGSGYVASHGADLARSRDPWFMGVLLQYGPDGGVFVLDWSDTGECHSVRNTRRETGRVFKITYGHPRTVDVDMSKLSDHELVQAQLHRNDWFVRHARRVLQERWAAGNDMAAARRELLAMYDEQPDVTRRLRALWALHVTGGLEDAFLIEQLSNADEHIRAWAIRLLCEDREPPARALERFRELADQDDSPYVRLHLTCALQRLPAERRWEIAEGLLQHQEDAADQNLPLMNWYAIEPLVDADLPRFVALARAAEIPLVRRHIARRAASHRELEAALGELVRLLHDVADSTARHDLLSGMLQGLEGRRRAPMPVEWPEVFERLLTDDDARVKQAAIELAVVFGDASALRTLQTIAGNRTTAADDRRLAIEALAKARAAETDALLVRIMRDPMETNAAVLAAALRGLAEFDHQATASTILERYTSLDSTNRQHALQTLAGRAAWATTLLDAIEADSVPRGDVTTFTARQLQSLGDDVLTARVKQVWGEIRTTPADKARQIGNLRRQLTPAVLARADRSRGRAVYDKTCANCHRLFDAGGAIGPNLTGSQRMNLDYVLENLVDPSAAVSRDFQMQVIQTTAGRVVTGLVVDESPVALAVQTVNERLVIPRDEIDSRQTSPLSMMPDGQLNTLTFEQIRDLIAYLAGPSQVPPMKSE
ncbi:MAG: c-type cytochrome, partial [Planctomycetales bacterium]|nr:c-type cytochrome [Planctomycetales bacterium]